MRRASHNQSRTVLVPNTYLTAVALRFHKHSRSTATSKMSTGRKDLGNAPTPARQFKESFFLRRGTSLHMVLMSGSLPLLATLPLSC